ncbi:hypothetical protein KKC87_03420 [Patescibacteria group bacterium]|nr:hypothetical protein [Patescibacteria group bacterium]
MIKTLKRILKNLLSSFRFWFFAVVLSLVAAVFLFIVWPYQNYNFRLSSKIAPALRVFYFNQSHHLNDPVKNCWYDSGDYIVFAHRNLKSLYYLSLAYSLSKEADTKKDLLQTINSQLVCVDEMIKQDWKQFRDQNSHGMNVPPIINQIYVPPAFYKFKPGEGKDIFALRALVAKNLGDQKGLEYFKDKTEKADKKTMSEQCCEEGPLAISDKDLNDILVMLGLAEFKDGDYDGGWGVSYRNIKLIEEKDYGRVVRMLKKLQDNRENLITRFDYIGGNYDLAGTIAIERMYERATGDAQFKSLSDFIYLYLHGKNQYVVDFTNYKKIYHPCGEWWSNCQLTATLINGIDEKRGFDVTRHDIWRLTEVQLSGQSNYVLMEILYNNY